MKRLINMAYILLFLFILTSQASAAAKNTQSIRVEVPISITIAGTLPEPAEDYIIIIEALEAANPMPAGVEGSTVAVKLTGYSKKSFPLIEYDEAGEYTYRIYQQAGNNAACIKYDDSVYKLCVKVTDNESFELCAEASLTKEDTDEKLSTVEFKNVYYFTPRAVETGDRNNIYTFAILLLLSAVAMFKTYEIIKNNINKP